MFEYLMPSLVMRAPSGSLLEQTNRLVVKRQEGYCNELGVPVGHLGIRLQRSQHRTDLPILELRRPRPRYKRGLNNDTVIAPYATGLAAMVRSGSGGPQLRAHGAAWRARCIRLVRGYRLHAVPPSRGREVCGRARIHGAPPGDDARFHLQCASRWRNACAFPCRTDDSGGRTSPAGAYAARHRARPAATEMVTTVVQDMTLVAETERRYRSAHSRVAAHT